MKNFLNGVTENLAGWKEHWREYWRKDHGGNLPPGSSLPKPPVPDNGHAAPPGPALPPPPPKKAPLPEPQAAHAAATANTGDLELPLQAVVNALPLEFKQRVRQNEVGTRTILISMDKVLSQLQSGSVKITFGELRQAVPQAFFSQADRDKIEIVLPLTEILARINPAMLGRRNNQKPVNVPEDINGPFGNRGQGLALSANPPRTPGQTPASKGHTLPAASPIQMPAVGRSVTPIQPEPPHPQVASAPEQPTGLQSVPDLFQKRNPKGPAPMPPMPPAAQPAAPAGSDIPDIFQKRTPAGSAAASSTPPAAESPASSIKIPSDTAFRTLMGAAAPHAPPRQTAPAAPKPEPPKPAPVKPVQAMPAMPPAPAKSVPAIPPRPAPAMPAMAPRPAPAMAAPAPASAPSSNAPLTVPLNALMTAWPEALRLEIGQLNLTDAKVVLPVDVIEPALKQGKIAFTWKQLRSWLQPAPNLPVSASDALTVDLPLKVIAPLFVASARGSAHKKVQVDENIPNLFFGFPQPEAETPEEPPAQVLTPPAPALASAPAPAAAEMEVEPAVVLNQPNKQTDTNYYVWDETSDRAKVDESDLKRPTPSGTDFMNRYATPNDIVSRASNLEGVAGALIALPDGLMVASKLSPELNGETLAAFLPHIFGKVSACTKELRMGDLNNLNFTVGLTPWKIFRVNAIFFAAFGRPGGPLPTGQLAALAAELDHKK